LPSHCRTSDGRPLTLEAAVVPLVAGAGLPAVHTVAATRRWSWHTSVRPTLALIVAFRLQASGTMTLTQLESQPRPRVAEPQLNRPRKPPAAQVRRRACY